MLNCAKQEAVRASESPVIRRATVALLVITLVAGTIIIDGVFARIYFYANRVRLENAASAAVIAGSMYLPGNPTMALKTARHYASLNGMRPEEIVAATLAPDNSSISITLKRAIPFYLSGAGVGQPTRPVIATEVAHAPPAVRGEARPPGLPVPRSHSYDL